MSKAEELLAEITKASIQEMILSQQIERLTNELTTVEIRKDSLFRQYQEVLAEMLDKN